MEMKNVSSVIMEAHFVIEEDAALSWRRGRREM